MPGADDSHICASRLDFFLKLTGLVYLNDHRTLILNMLKEEVILSLASICSSFVLHVREECLKSIKITSWNLCILQSVQFSSVTQSCPTLCDPMNRSTPGLPVHHQLPECTQTHVHRVSDAIQPSHPLSCPSPPAPNPSQHQSLFQ